MKKLILSLVFVLATGTSFMNANNIYKGKLPLIKGEVENIGVCDDVYFAVRDAYFEVTGDLYGAITAAMDAEETCAENEPEIIELVIYRLRAIYKFKTQIF